jgi:hypothetical protein
MTNDGLYRMEDKVSLWRGVIPGDDVFHNPSGQVKTEPPRKGPPPSSGSGASVISIGPPIPIGPPIDELPPEGK